MAAAQGAGPLPPVMAGKRPAAMGEVSSPEAAAPRRHRHRGGRRCGGRPTPQSVGPPTQSPLSDGDAQEHGVDGCVGVARALGQLHLGGQVLDDGDRVQLGRADIEAARQRDDEECAEVVAALAPLVLHGSDARDDGWPTLCKAECDPLALVSEVLASTPLVPCGAVSENDETFTHPRTAVHCSSTPSVPRGAAAHGAAHKAGRRPFIFCAARGPDVHVPKSCRFGRADWLLLERYDSWIAGEVLDESDPMYGDEFKGCPLAWLLEPDRPCSEAARVTSLLAAVLSPGFHWMSVGLKGVIDVRLPAASQLDKVKVLGYTAIPTAGEVMKRMVAHSEYMAADLQAEQACDRLYEERVQLDAELFMGGDAFSADMELSDAANAAGEGGCAFEAHFSASF